MSTPSVTSHPSFRLGTIIRACHRLWHEDQHEGEEFLATTIVGGETEQRCLYLGLDHNDPPFEYIEPTRLDLPDHTRVGYPAAQNLLLRACHLSLLHGSASLLSLQLSRMIPTNYHLVPIALTVEELRVRLAIFNDVGLGMPVEARLLAADI